MDDLGTAIRDGAVGAIWIVQNVLLVRCAFRWSDRLRPGEGRGELWLAALILYFAVVTSCVAALGTFGVLSGWSVMSAAALVLGVETLAERRIRKRRPEWVRKPRRQPAVFDRSNPWDWLWAAAIVYLAAHAVVHGTLRPPVDFDSLAYHVPLIDSWLQQGSLYAPQNANWFLSAQNELFGVWLCAPFSGDFLIGVVNLPAFAICGLGAFAFGRTLGLRDSLAHATTFVVLVTFPALFQIGSASNDVPVVAFFCSGAYFVLSYLRTLRSADLALFGICLGALAGTKYFAIGYAAVLALASLPLILRRRGFRAGTLAAVQALAIAGGIGGHWYLRNWIVAGSPLFPIGVDGDARALGYPSLWTTTLIGSVDPRVPWVWVEAVWKMAGPWHWAGVVASPALAVYAAYRSLRRRPGRSHDGPLTALAGAACTEWTLYGTLLVGSAAVWAATPYAVEDIPGTLNQAEWGYTPVRYGFCFLSLAALGLSSVWQTFVDKLHRSSRYVPLALAPTLLAILGGWQVVQFLLRPAFTFLIEDSLLVAIVGGGLVAASAFLRSQMRGPAASAFVALQVVAGAACLTLLSQNWHAEFAPFYDRFLGTRVFSRLEGDAEKRLCVLDRRPYPFFGSDRMIRVIQPRFPGKASELAALAQDRRIDGIVVGPVRPTIASDYYKSASILEGAPEEFRLAFESGGWRIYERIDRGDGDGGEFLSD